MYLYTVSNLHINVLLLGQNVEKENHNGSNTCRAVTITASPLHRGNEMPTAVLRSSPSSPHFFSRDPTRFLAAGIKHGNGR